MKTYRDWLLEAIEYIGQDQWREESEDIYRKHFWFPTLYDKKPIWSITNHEITVHAEEKRK